MYRVTVQQTLACVGTDPEFADIDNPRGERYEVQCYLQLDLPNGRRWAGPTVPFATGERMAAGLQRSINRGYDPTTSEAFVEVTPAYGSEAYIKGGHESIEAQIEKNEAAIREGFN